MNQTDIVPVLKSFDLMMDDKEEIIVLNPPVLNTNDMVNEVNNAVGSD